MPGALAGVRVLDLATIVAGPYACQMLGDFGADVIKIEHPQGDPLRGHGPQVDGVGLWWKSIARNKAAVAIDLHDVRGADIVKRLVAEADVLVESFRPGTLEKWGLGWQELSAINPRLIMLRISGFGQTGPYRDRPGFGTLAEAMSGFAAMTGEPGTAPMLPPFGLADGVAGLAGAVSVLSALYQRDARGGLGQVIDLAILEPLISVLGAQATAHAAVGLVPERFGNRSSNNAPRNVYPTKDGQWVAVSSSATPVAIRVMHLVGRPDLAEQPWFQTGAGRAAHGAEIDASVADWIKDRTRQEVLDSFERAEAAAAPIYDIAELVQDPHVQARNIFRAVTDPDLGSVVLQEPFARMSRTPATVRFPGRELGADTARVLGGLAGVTVAELGELRAAGVVV